MVLQVTVPQMTATQHPAYPQRHFGKTPRKLLLMGAHLKEMGAILS
jgi:hypothetical protein